MCMCVDVCMYSSMTVTYMPPSHTTDEAVSSCVDACMCVDAYMYSSMIVTYISLSHTGTASSPETCPEVVRRMWMCVCVWMRICVLL
jgi:hypothetical protein